MPAYGYWSPLRNALTSSARWNARELLRLHILPDRSSAYLSSFIVVAINDIKRVRALEAYMGYDEEAQDEAMEISE